LDGRDVGRISAYLVEGELDRSPARLASNLRKAFSGSIPLGLGFIFDDEAATKGLASYISDMKQLIARNPANGERIFPFIGGEDVNTHPRHAYDRYVIDFADFPLLRDPQMSSWASMDERDQENCVRLGAVPSDYPCPVAGDWPDLLDIVRRLVKPKRDLDKREPRRLRWWRFAERAVGLYAAIQGHERVVVASRISSQPSFTFLRTNCVIDVTLNTFVFSSSAMLAVLQARSHEIWARLLASSMKDDLRYTPSDCFETFPLPLGFDGSPELESIGCAYYDHRAALMVARSEGMTKTYNRFHDPTETAEDIQRLRDLHAEMDCAVLETYDWRDLAARAQPIFLDETNEDDHAYQGRLFWPSDFRDEVLARLLALNAERHADELRRGVAPRIKGNAEDESDDDAGTE
jgi:hypothetical protein